MKAPVDEMLATEIAGHVAVVVTKVVAAADGLARLGFARQSGRGEWAETVRHRNAMNAVCDRSMSSTARRNRRKNRATQAALATGVSNGTDRLPSTRTRFHGDNIEGCGRTHQVARAVCAR
ncbi:hypothetical protein [Burkholderia cepacia]|uniref:hypothetical protein n=1 Tax=Burkholderia cepacia TaxID=292 RepID=UPI0009BCA8EF|nr:hypothetical protein [Burkholderia cepacia]MCA7905123.1 hypothetical protein [Burkholderia cepacia]MCA7982053.1 hypothetical protein [Burkholderia cepacia]